MSGSRLQISQGSSLRIMASP